MRQNKNHFRVYMDVLRDVQEIIEKFGIAKKDNALADLIHMISYGRLGDWALWMMANEPYLEDVARYNTFEEIPDWLQQVVLRSMRGYGRDGLLRIDKSADGKGLEYHWEEPGAAAWATIESCDGELSADFVEQANSRGVNVIFSTGGYTEAAKALARKYWINLETD